MKLLSFLQIWIQSLELELQATLVCLFQDFFFIDEIVVDFANVDPNLRA
jgi:hypothetical protein